VVHVCALLLDVVQSRNRTGRPGPENLNKRGTPRGGGGRYEKPTTKNNPHQKNPTAWQVTVQENNSSCGRQSVRHACA